jgi:hypothetical protein
MPCNPSNLLKKRFENCCGDEVSSAYAVLHQITYLKVYIHILLQRGPIAVYFISDSCIPFLIYYRSYAAPKCDARLNTGLSIYFDFDGQEDCKISLNDKRVEHIRIAM